jgi:hypothetical protein
MTRGALVLAIVGLAAFAGAAQGRPARARPPVSLKPPILVELYTAQGCGTCGAASAHVASLATDKGVIPLTFAVDYWDYLGWKDTLADSRFSARQKAYSQMRGDRDVYTPQAIINGEVHVVGSDRAGIEDAILDTTKSDDVMSVPVSMTLSGRQLNVSVAASHPGSSANHGEIWICAISKAVPILIGRGENRGHEVTYHNVVRNLLKVGDWNGTAQNWSVPLENISREGVDAAAVYVQDGNHERPGPMLGAAFTSLH